MTKSLKVKEPTGKPPSTPNTQAIAKHRSFQEYMNHFLCVKLISFVTVMDCFCPALVNLIKKKFGEFRDAV